MIKKCVMFLVALMFIIFGISGLVVELDLEDGLAVVSGPLVIEHTAADPDVDLGLPFSYPLLSRTVEMAQYIKRGSVVLLELSSRDPDKKVEGTSGDKKIVVENPPFPKWIRRHAYFGGISIASGDQKLRLHERLLSMLYFSDSDNFENKTERYVVARKLVEDEESWRGGKLVDRFVDTGDLKVGDIIVTWRSIRPASLAQAYSVYGLVHGGMIGDRDHDVDMFDRAMTVDEFQEAHFDITGSRTFGKALIVIGVILMVTPILAKFKK